MCGIAGILKFAPHARAEPRRLERMREILHHRGPDDSGIELMGPAGFAHCRLSIIDPKAGRQPMLNAAGDVCITYNGEIYNYRELRTRLRALGCTFTTASDTEVVLQAYEKFGDACVQELRGMFAFAIWDARRGRLFMARDRLGIKPLYYMHRGDELLFGSEIKAIFAAGGGRPALNQAIIPEFLATRYVGGSETFYAGVRKLLPGHTMSWAVRGQMTEQRYWQLPAQINESFLTLEEQAGGLRTRLEEAVRSHLVSDVPLGLFLSGGLDSSALAALMAPMMDDPVRTFAVGFDDPACNELHYARLVAGAIGAEHREVILSPKDFFTALPKLIWHEDEPIAFTSSVPLYFVSRLAQQHVKVVLTGEGADELFLGYNRYRVTAWNERLSRFVPQGMQGLLARGLPYLPGPVRRYAERSFLALDPGIRALFFENFAVFNERRQQDLLTNPDLLSARDPYAAGMRCYGDAPAGMLDRLSRADLQTYLVELLMKQDQMSMAASIESRVPFLDHQFVEYAAALPSRYKLQGTRTKAVLRAAMRNLVPHEILTRRKMGFPVPIAEWLRGEFAHLVDEFVVGPRTLKRGLFRADYLKRLAGEHRAGAARHGDRLWLLLNLEIWMRLVLDGEQPASILKAARGAAPLMRAA